MKSNQHTRFGVPPEVPLKWFQIAPAIDNDGSDSDHNLIFKYSKMAENLLAEEVLKYSNKQHGSNRYQHNWMKTIMSKGTLADKVAAQIVQVQNSPIHSLALISNLTSMVKVGKKKECLQVMENLVELWLSDLLVPDRKLVPFSARPLQVVEKLDQAQQHKCLVYWWFEGKLKELYIAFIKALDVISKDSIESIKGKAIGCMSKLLAANAEQEQLLLSQLVNKLGDPHQEVASKAIHYLQKVLKKHPNMQPVVLEEVEKMIFRPNIQEKAQYYAVCFLIQFHLSLEDKVLASNMINLYFCLFKACIKKGELDSRMMQNLLSGVKRAFPYAKDSFSDTLADHVDTLHKLVHVSSFGVALHALCLLHQVAQASNTIEDRFYSALYKKLLDPEVIKTKHLALFLNIVYKSLKSDTKPERVQAFVKRLLQLALYAPSNFACAILYLISQAICRNKDQIILELKVEEDAVKFEEDDDEDEKYSDVKLDEDQESEKQDLSKPSGSWSWVEDRKGQRKHQSNPNEYEPFSRNPLFTKAEKVGLRELVLLANHYHPTVSMFAQNLLDKEVIKYSGDVLVDFSSARFLDRFSFKNPKKDAQKGPLFSRTSQYQPKGIRSLRIDSTRFLNIAEEQIPKEDLFMYRYMQKKMQMLAEKKEEEEEKEDSDNESVNSEEFENMLFGNRKDLDDDEVDQDEEIDEGSIDFEHDVVEAESNAKGKKKKKKPVLVDDDEDGDFSDDGDLPNDFASAEEFAEMLQNAGIEDDAAGSNAVSNADNSHAKQLKWEQNRDRWVRGGNKRKAKGPMKMSKGKKRKTK